MNSLPQAIKIAKDTIHLESDAIRELEATILSDAFTGLLQLATMKTRRFVFTGIGKSAIIAQKIVATFNSTGTPAVFLHAADAVHGDLGLVMQDDIMCILSKSGETPEIRLLVSLVKDRGIKLVAFTAVADSFLGLSSHLSLITPVSREADPYNLAPTTSSTVQLALGDALAMAIMHLKGFNEKDFARFHPGGALGKQLFLTVQDLYIRYDKPQVNKNASIREVIYEITSKRLGAAVVLSEQLQVAGIITDGDLRRMMQNHVTFDHLTAEDIMTVNPKCIQKNALAAEALQMMKQYAITQLPAIDEDGIYLGIVHLHDILKEGII